MTRVAWIGPLYGGQKFRSAVAAPGVEVLELDGVESALTACRGQPPEVAVVVVDSEEGSGAMPALRSAWPRTQILAATRLGVPPHVAGALGSGAADLVDLRAPDSDSLRAQVQRAIDRFARAAQEHELLVRVRQLHEAFLKNFVELEKRNIELEKRLGQAPIGPSLEQKCRILVVDDEPAILKIFELMLAGDYPLTTVDNAEHALALFRAQPFPIVVTDKNLPGMSGLQLAREVKKIAPECEIVMITGYGSKDAAIEALNCGVGLFLEKPFENLAEVSDKLAAVAARWSGRLDRSRLLHTIKERNRDFLDQYRVIRADLELCLRGERDG